MAGVADPFCRNNARRGLCILYAEQSYFTLPFETAESLRHRLEETFGPVRVHTVQSMASFVCQKAKEKRP